MIKYLYPAVFTKEQERGFSVEFPNVEGAYTCGDTWVDAYNMAEDVLALKLFCLLEQGKKLPIPSKVDEIKVKQNSTVMLVKTDMLFYRGKNSKKTKKTVSIPKWLYKAAKSRDVNFNEVFQTALIEHLKI
jgi:antitoxin HicB